MRLTKTVALTLASITATVGLAGCATNTTGSSAGAGAAVDSRAAADYAQLVTDIWGTSADRQLADRLAHHRMQAAIAACMRAAGHGYNPPAYQGIGGAAPIAIGDIDGAAPIGTDWGIATGKLQNATGIQQTQLAGGNRTGLATGAAGVAYSKAMDRCQNAGDFAAESTYPPGTLDLSQSLENGLRGVTTAADYTTLHSQYLTCLSRAGYHVDSWAQLHQQTLARFPTVSVGVDDLRANTAFQAASDAEQAAARADADCRAALYAYTMQAIAPHIDRMRTEGGKAITEVINGWATLRTQAQAAGIR